MALITDIAIGISANVTGLTSGLAKAGRALDKFASRVRRSVSGLIGIRKAFSSFAGQLTIFSGLTVAFRGFTSAIREGIKFESELTRSLAIQTKEAKSNRKEFRRLSIELSKTFGRDASDVARGIFFLASAGQTATQQLESLPTVLQFATAGAFDLATATDLLTDAQSALSLTSKDNVTNLANLSRVADVLVKSNTLANASVQQFSEAITAGAGASLTALGLQIEEIAALLTVLADRGIKGADASTKLKSAFRDLTRAAVENAGAFERAGIAVFDDEGAVNRASIIIGQLENRLNSLSASGKRFQLLELGLPSKSIDSLLLLLGTSEKLAANYIELKENSDGFNKSVSDFSLQAVDNKLKQVASTLKEIGIEFITQLKNRGFFDALVKGARQFSQVILKLPEHFSRVNEAIARLAEKWRLFLKFLEDSADKLGINFPKQLAKEMDEAADAAKRFDERQARIGRRIKEIKRDEFERVEIAKRLFNLEENLRKAIVLAQKAAGPRDDKTKIEDAIQRANFLRTLAFQRLTPQAGRTFEEDLKRLGLQKQFTKFAEEQLQLLRQQRDLENELFEAEQRGVLQFEEATRRRAAALAKLLGFGKLQPGEIGFRPTGEAPPTRAPITDALSDPAVLARIFRQTQHINDAKARGLAITAKELQTQEAIDRLLIREVDSANALAKRVFDATRTPAERRDIEIKELLFAFQRTTEQAQELDTVTKLTNDTLRRGLAAIEERFQAATKTVDVRRQERDLLQEIADIEQGIRDDAEGIIRANRTNQEILEERLQQANRLRAASQISAFLGGDDFFPAAQFEREIKAANEALGDTVETAKGLTDAQRASRDLLRDMVNLTERLAREAETPVQLFERQKKEIFAALAFAEQLRASGEQNAFSEALALQLIAKRRLELQEALKEDDEVQRSRSGLGGARSAPSAISRIDPGAASAVAQLRAGQPVAERQREEANRLLQNIDDNGREVQRLLERAENENRVREVEIRN